MSDNFFPLIELPRRLRKVGIVVSYPFAWRAVVDGRIPAHRDGKRWLIDPADMPTIRNAFTPAEGAR